MRVGSEVAGTEGTAGIGRAFPNSHVRGLLCGGFRGQLGTGQAPPCLAVVHARRQLLLLCVLGMEVRPSPGRHDTRHRPVRPPARHPRQAPVASRGSDSPGTSSTGLLQVLRLLRHQPLGVVRSGRGGFGSAVPPARRPGRDLVHHLQKHLVLVDCHRGDLEPVPLDRDGHLPLVLPVCRRGTHHPGQRGAPAVPVPAQAHRHRRHPGPLSSSAWVWSRRSSSATFSPAPSSTGSSPHPGSTRPWTSWSACTPTPSRSTAISAATPTWPSGSPCCSASALPINFDRPYTAALGPRFLAALAHHALALAAGLPLHPPRGQPALAAPRLLQRDRHHAAGRALARRGLDVPGLGRHARRGAGGRARSGHPAEEARAARPGARHGRGGRRGVC